MKRLRAIFGDFYDMLLAEERAAVGLDPWPIETVVGANPGLGAEETVDFAAVYHALDEHGVTADGIEDQDEGHRQ